MSICKAVSRVTCRSTSHTIDAAIEPSIKLPQKSAQSGDGGSDSKDGREARAAYKRPGMVGDESRILV